MDDKVTIWRKPSAAMLRPFMGCPDDELELAWAAMLHIAEREQRVAGMAVKVDPSLPHGTIEVRDERGKVLGTIINAE
jgi:hypothetical protein